MNKNARQIWEYDSLAKFNQVGGAVGHGEGLLICGNKLYKSNGIQLISLFESHAISIGASGFFGMAQNLGVNGTMHLTCRAPGDYSHVQLIILGQNCSSISASAAPSAVFGSGASAGMQPKDAGGVAIAPTLFTFGTTDVNDLNNPGGGSATGAISNQSGGVGTYPAVAGAKQGFVATDWLPLQSLNRSDGGSNPLTMFRWQAPFDIPVGNRTPGWRNNGLTLADIDIVEPELRQTYAGASTVNVTTLNMASFAGTSGGTVPVPANNAHFAVAIPRYILKTAPHFSIGSVGDSTSVGYNGGFGQIYGPGRIARDILIGLGYSATFAELGLATDLSENFHYRAKYAIENKLFSHMLIQASSLNDGTTDDALARAHQRTRQLIADARNAGIAVVVIVPRRQSGSMFSTSNQFIAELRNAAVPTVSQSELLCNPGTNVTNPLYDSGDGTHFTADGYLMIGRAVADLLK
ncbi:SGNH/GDSL hydrolase family protein [Methylomonas fluvii]|uniref:SGNH/GDSL hydrolase family protein n=1 Tax=Methylomonas fluvii TaxID=1854564 RepID=A0ABR9DIH6_9GAMM|nr:SGNH/GDSL hydrolase family protein [Methylomonas fluvii]MBD9362907.1 SGNH/GDSL hydrolase family protein [Methylomonas fluvii]